MSVHIDGIEIVGGKTVEVWNGSADVKNADGKILATFSGIDKIEVTIEAADDE